VPPVNPFPVATDVTVPVVDEVPAPISDLICAAVLFNVPLLKIAGMPVSSELLVPVEPVEYL